MSKKTIVIISGDFGTGNLLSNNKKISYIIQYRINGVNKIMRKLYLKASKKFP